MIGMDAQRGPVLRSHDDQAGVESSFEIGQNTVLDDQRQAGNGSVEGIGDRGIDRGDRRTSRPGRGAPDAAKPGPAPASPG
jgi:hypothetical protein